MAVVFPLVLDDGGETTVVEVDEDELPELGSVLPEVGVPTALPVVVVVGGAGGMTDQDPRRLRPVFAGLATLLEDHRGAAVDGGTDAGVMRLLGDARLAARASFPLIGVAARGTVALGGRPRPPGDGAGVAPGHSHLLLVPGDEWGDESRWIGDVATAVAGASPSVTLVVNGGDVAYTDVEHSQRLGRRVVVAAGSGRTADALAAAVRRESSADRRARAIVAEGLVTSVPVSAPAAVVDEIGRHLQLR